MPATIIGNNEWNQRGLVLTAQDAQEQINGLVNVQVEYVGPSSKHDIISRSFYQDAPPPIWPDVVNRSELVTNRLYMESRTVTRANGLTTVQATYVGGLQRAGFKGYFLSEQKEPDKTANAYNFVRGTSNGIGGIAIFAYDEQGAARQVGLPTLFIFTELVKRVEFVSINNQNSFLPPVFYRKDIASIRNRFGATSEIINSFDLWTIDGSEIKTVVGALSFSKDTPIPLTESAQYITPTVKIVSLEYRLS